MDQADILRLLIILLALTAPILIIIRNHRKRHHLSWGDVLTRLGVGVTFVAIAYSTAESFIQNASLATRLYVLIAALVWVNVGLASSIIYERKLAKEEAARTEENQWP
jgi:hypothetical protein